MMSLEAIHELSARIAIDAEQEGREPLMYPFENLNRPRIPSIGDYVPPGWDEVGEPLFVDSSGLGLPGEPALTQVQFMEQLQYEHEFGFTDDEIEGETRRYEGPFAYAVIEEGQFQVYVGRFVLA